MRIVRCFASESIAPDSPFARWAAFDLPYTIRFVGTVNADETTKRLSQRLLDRANVIRLRPGDVPASAGEGRPLPAGPSVTLSHLSAVDS